MRFLVIAAGLILVTAAAPARADVVTLQNGVQMTGVLEKNEDGDLTLKVSQDGSVVLDSATVVSIQRQSKGENAKIVAGWNAAADAETAQTVADRRYVEAQRAKGLIEYQGEWLTPSQFDRRLALDRFEFEKDAAATPRVVVTNYYYTSYHAHYSYASYLESRAVHLYGDRSRASAVPVARYRPPGMAGYHLTPAGELYRARPVLFDHEAGMGAGAHYGW